jgi:hypothetical protein
MSIALLRVDEKTRDRIKVIAHKEKKSIGEVVTSAIDRYERDKFFEDYNAAYAKLSSEELKELREEQEIWDGTISDGIEEE